jgi:hypothetical protein
MPRQRNIPALQTDESRTDISLFVPKDASWLTLAPGLMHNTRYRNPRTSMTSMTTTIEHLLAYRRILSLEAVRYAGWLNLVLLKGPIGTFAKSQSAWMANVFDAITRYQRQF